MNVINKKSLIISLLILFGFNFVFAQQWSQPIEVSAGNTPDMDIDKNSGNVFVLTMLDGVNITVFDKDGNFVSQENVPGTSGDKGNEGGIPFGATIGVDTEGYPHICYRQIVYDVSWDHYSTFYKRKRASGWSEKNELVHNNLDNYMVRIELDPENNAHITNGFAFLNSKPLGNINYFKYKQEKRLEKTLDLGNHNYVYRSDNQLEIDSYGTDQIHIISGVPNPTGKLYYLYSADGGERFTSGENIRAGTNESRCGSPDMQVDGNGLVHFCYGESEDELTGGTPSVHYGRIENFIKVKDDVVTTAGELLPWPSSLKIGVGSIGCSDDGQRLVLAYVEQPEGPLYARYSMNMGESWSEPVQVAASCGGYDGRDKQIVRGNGNTFYLAYTSEDKVWLRTMTLNPNQPPVADAGGPYIADEGSVIIFDASASADSDGTILQYAWDWENDGVFDDTTDAATTSHTYPDDYTGQMALIVSDDFGATDTTFADVTVNNLPPVANANGPYSGDKNVDIAVNGSAMDPGVVDVLSYAWDLDADGTFETEGQSANARFSTSGAHEIRLHVRDDDGGEGFDTTVVQIANEPPLVSVIPGQQIAEGSIFTPIYLDNYIADPDNDDNDLSWVALGEKNILVTITDRVARIAVVDSNWFGADTITFKVTDPGNLSDQTDVIFTVTNVNDAPVLSAITSQTKQEGETFDPIDVDDYASDIDNAVSELSWTISEQSELSYEWNEHVLQILTPNETWFGSENLLFTVTDPGGLCDTQTVRFTMQEVNDPPIISGLSGQQIEFDQTFTPIELDSVVTDANHDNNQLQWSVLPTTHLTVTIYPARIAVITRIQQDWSGSESITFVVSDGSLSDSAGVVFTVGDLLASPVIGNIPQQTVSENQPFQPIYLDGYVYDADNADSELSWQVTANDLNIQVTERVLTVTVPDSEWVGNDTLRYIVSDPGGLSDTSSATYTVVGVNDPPQPFQIISPNAQTYTSSPDSILFSWCCAFDPDVDDQLGYELNVSDDSQLNHVIDRFSNLGDSCFVYQPSPDMAAGTYYWQVTASDLQNAFAKSDIGTFSISYTDVAEHNNLQKSTTWRLAQNYPNPFNPETTITFELPVSEHVLLTIYNMKGQLIKQLLNENKDAGIHQFKWNAADEPAGIYLCKIKAGEFSETIKLMLLK